MDGGTQLTVVPAPDGVPEQEELFHLQVLLDELLAHEKYRAQMRGILEDATTSNLVHFPFEIDAMVVFTACPAASKLLHVQPNFVLTRLETALKEIFIFVCEQESRHREGLTVKANVHPRICRLPPIGDYVRPNISSIAAHDQGKLITVSGTVLSMSNRMVAIRLLTFQCEACEFEFHVPIEVEHDNTFRLPKVCPSPVPTKGKRCSSSKFAGTNKDQIVFTDYREIRVQESVQSLEAGAMPQSIRVVLENDLLEAVRAGDDVQVTGEVLHRWRDIGIGKRMDLERILRANHIRTLRAQGLTGSQGSKVLSDFHEFWHFFNSTGRSMTARDIIVRSMCPQLVDMAQVKLAVLLTLLGGVKKGEFSEPPTGPAVSEGDAAGKQGGSGAGAGASSAGSSSSSNQQQRQHSSQRIRGDSHLLMVGDPGTGKSQFLEFSRRLMPRSVMTTGTGTSSAGLTAAAVRSGNEHVLEAGALVLADRGLCCIDEFACISTDDQGAIHEAMEQQTIHFMKAGLAARLRTRCTILASCNPKGGKFDPAEDMVANTGLKAPLLSRFDLLMVLLDQHERGRDTQLSWFILGQAYARGRVARVTQRLRGGVLGDDVFVTPEQERAAAAAGHEQGEGGWDGARGSSVASQPPALLQQLSGEELREATRQLANKQLAVSARERTQAPAYGRPGGGGFHAESTQLSSASVPSSSSSSSFGGAPNMPRVAAEPLVVMDGLETVSAPEGTFTTRLADGRLVDPLQAGCPPLAWSFVRLQAYVLWVRDNVTPDLSQAAGRVLSQYFVLARQSEHQAVADGNSATVRMLEGLIRLTQAHARLMFRRRAVLDDAVVAVLLMDRCRSSQTDDGKSSALLMGAFARDPDGSFARNRDMILGTLGLRGLTETEDPCSCVAEHDQVVLPFGNNDPPPPSDGSEGPDAPAGSAPAAGAAPAGSAPSHLHHGASSRGGSPTASSTGPSQLQINAPPTTNHAAFMYGQGSFNGASSMGDTMDTSGPVVLPLGRPLKPSGAAPTFTQRGALSSGPLYASSGVASLPKQPAASQQSSTGGRGADASREHVGPDESFSRILPTDSQDLTTFSRILPTSAAFSRDIASSSGAHSYSGPHANASSVASHASSVSASGGTKPELGRGVRADDVSASGGITADIFMAPTISSATGEASNRSRPESTGTSQIVSRGAAPPVSRVAPAPASQSQGSTLHGPQPGRPPHAQSVQGEKSLAAAPPAQPSPAAANGIGKAQPHAAQPNLAPASISGQAHSSTGFGVFNDDEYQFDWAGIDESQVIQPEKVQPVQATTAPPGAPGVVATKNDAGRSHSMPTPATSAYQQPSAAAAALQHGSHHPSVGVIPMKAALVPGISTAKAPVIPGGASAPPGGPHLQAPPAGPSAPPQAGGPLSSNHAASASHDASSDDDCDALLAVLSGPVTAGVRGSGSASAGARIRAGGNRLATTGGMSLEDLADEQSQRDVPVGQKRARDTATELQRSVADAPSSSAPGPGPARAAGGEGARRNRPPPVDIDSL